MAALYRSLLYVPASNARAMEKARTLPCDGIIYDLEDAVAPQDKAAAREAVVAALKLDHGHRQIIVRVNDLSSEWCEGDLRALAHTSAGVLLPKVMGPDDVRAARRILRNDGPLWVMMETPRAILRAADIAACSPPITGMIMGLNDLAKELKVAQTQDRQALLYSLSACVLAARASGCLIIDAVYGDIKNQAGFAASCAQGRLLGFDGKTVIHPTQIEVANSAFAPQADELEMARKVVAAWEEAAGKGVITVDGQMIEALHVEQARETLALHAAIAAREK